MPGMMDTVLNVGLNDVVVEGLAKQVNDRFAWDCYRRLLQMFGDVVLGIDHDDFEHELSAIKKAAGAKFDIELTAAHLKELVTKYKVCVWVVFWGCFVAGLWVFVLLHGDNCGAAKGWRDWGCAVTGQGSDAHSAHSVECTKRLQKSVSTWQFEFLRLHVVVSWRQRR